MQLYWIYYWWMSLNKYILLDRTQSSGYSDNGCIKMYINTTISRWNYKRKTLLSVKLVNILTPSSC